jgi:uncharacterized protein (TIRG00374 family)
MQRRSTKRLLTIGAATAVTALALWLSFRNVEWAEIGNAFARANYAWIAAAMANSLIDVYFLGFRWRFLLAPRARVSMPALFRLNMIALYANILMPARVSEVLRAWMISREASVPGGFALGTIAIERIFDVAIFMALWVASPALFAGRTAAFPPAAAYVSGGLAIAVLVLFVLRPVAFLKGSRFAFKVLPAGLREKARRFTESGIEAFAGLKDPKAVVTVAALSLGILVFRVLTLVLVGRAFRLEVSLGAALFVLLVRQVGDIPPAAPGRIGIFEYTVIVALAAFGIARTPALSYAVMLHLVAQVPKIILGGAFVGIKGLPHADHESAGSV